MADYYSGYGGTSKKKPRSLAMRIVDLAMTLLSAVVAVMMVLTFFVPGTHPARIAILPVLGLIAPATYVATVLLTLWWIIRWRWIRASPMLLLALIGLFRISLFYKPELRKVYDETISERGTFKIMTYNVHGFRDAHGTPRIDEIPALIDSMRPDVICFQEFNTRLAARSEAFMLLASDYESPVFDNGFDMTTASAPMVILSKYRILRSGVGLDTATSVWADVLMDADTVRIFNNHLLSTNITAADDDYLTQRRFLSDTLPETKVRNMLGRFRYRSEQRATQVDSLKPILETGPRRRIVCGDFNDTPVSYVYGRMSEGLNDAFRVCGSGYSHTFRGFYDLLRIDYVLSSDDFETRSYEVVETDCSDHLPVFVRLKKETETN